MLKRLQAKARGVAGVFVWPTGESHPVDETAGVIAGTSNRAEEEGPAGEAAIRFLRVDRAIIVPVTALLKAGQPEQPVVGLRWNETINGVPSSFELMRVEGQPAWDWTDTGRTRYRLNLKRVKS
jgi:hypothetical protein